MPYTIIYNSDAHIIETRIQGDIDLNEIKELLTELAQISKEKNCTLLLGDYREARIKINIALDVFKVIKIASDIYLSSGLNTHGAKRALVFAKNLEAKWIRYYENVMVNRGYNAKVFYDLDEAKKWLLGE
jgi:hypothetical protein